MLFNTEQLTHVMVSDKCLNPALGDQTANILITVSPNVSQKHSISKHDSPIISMVLSISWYIGVFHSIFHSISTTASGRIWGGKCSSDVH